VEEFWSITSNEKNLIALTVKSLLWLHILHVRSFAVNFSFSQMQISMHTNSCCCELAAANSDCVHLQIHMSFDVGFQHEWQFTTHKYLQPLPSFSI